MSDATLPQPPSQTEPPIRLRFEALCLQSERLWLRPLCDSDEAALFAMHSDPEVMRYWSTSPWTDPQQARDMIAWDAQGLPAGDHLRLALGRHGSDELLGTCSLFSLLPQCRRAELGYVLARPAWGQGLMDEALRTLLTWAFEALNLNRLEADIDPRNAASERALRRLGFQQEGFLRQRWIVDGVVSDTALFGLLRSDWDAQAAGSATRLAR